MGRKRIPSEAEIQELAVEFRVLWKQGEALRPWLRRHRKKLLEMVHGEWSWAALARALTKAEITFSTGKPWSDRTLCHEFVHATARLKGYARRRKSSNDTGAELNNGPAVESGAVFCGEPQKVASPLADTIVPHKEPGEQISVAKPAKPFKPFTLKPYVPPRAFTPDEIREHEELRLRLYGK